MSRYLIIALAMLAADIATEKIVDWQFAHGAQKTGAAHTAYPTTDNSKLNYLFLEE